MAAGHVHCEGGFVVHGVIGLGHGMKEFQEQGDGHSVVLLKKSKEEHHNLAQHKGRIFVKQASEC